MIRLAALIALQVVLSRFLSINVGSVLKFSFGFVPIVLAAHLYGIPGACAVAAISDLLGAILFPQGPFFIGYTLTAALTGLLYGLFLYKKRGAGVSDLRIALAFTVNAMLVTILLNTFVIALQYGYLLAKVKDTANIAKRFWAFLPKRALEALIMLPIQCVTSAMLLKPRKSALLRQALLPLGALLIALALNVDLSSLRPLNEGEALVRYLCEQLFPDSLIGAALFVGALALLLRVRKNEIGLAANLSGLVLALVYTVSSYFYKSSAAIPSDVILQLVLFGAFVGAFLLFRALSALAFKYLDKLEGGSAAFNRRRCALVLFVCCIPWLLVTFPGTLSADAYDQLSQFMGTLYPGRAFSRSAAVSALQSENMLINDAQSVLHTLVLGAFYWVFWRIGNSGLGIYFFVLAQALLFSLIAARSLELLSRAGLKSTYLKALTAFYALFPLYPMYICATLKESALALALMSALTFIAETVLFPKEMFSRHSRLIGGSAAILICLLLRSFTALLLMPLVIYALVQNRRENRRPLVRLSCACLGAYAVWALICYGVYPLAGVGKAPGVEARSLMLQQTALYAIENRDGVVSGGDLSEDSPVISQEDWVLMTEVYGTDKLEENYLPYDADPLKFYTPDSSNPTLYQANALHYSDWDKFDALWLKLGRRGFDPYLRAYLAMNASYWDLRHDAASGGLQLYLGDYGRFENGLENENQRATEGIVEIHVSDFNLKLQRAVSSITLALSRLPVLSLLFRGGAFLYALLIVLIYALKTHRKGWILPMILLLYGIGLGFGPVSGNTRYAFPIILCAPFIVFLSAVLPRESDTLKTKE